MPFLRFKATFSNDNIITNNGFQINYTFCNWFGMIMVENKPLIEKRNQISKFRIILFMNMSCELYKLLNTNVLAN